MELKPLEQALDQIEGTDQKLTKKNLRIYVQQNSDENPDELISLYRERDYISLEDGQVRITDKAREELKTSLENLYGAFGEHYHIGDTKKIDLMLATALSVKSTGKPIWLLYVGASGIGKNIITEPLRHVELDGEPLARTVSDLTKNTIASGMPGKDSDLASHLDNRVMYFPDFSTIVEKRSETQKAIFSQLRNLYDGLAKKDTGSFGDSEEYEVHVTFLGNVTPAIYQKSLIHQSMGTRFVFFRVADFNAKKVEEKIREKGDLDEGKVAEEIANTIEEILNQLDYSLENVDIPDQDWNEIVKIARWTAKMRAAGNFDSYTNELKQDITPEKHTRILKQLKKVYKHLQLLDEDYPDERALEILRHIGKSCVDKTKIQIFNELSASDLPLDHTELQDRLEIGYRTVQRRLWEMQNVGIIERSDGLGMKKDMSEMEEGKTNEDRGWRVNPEFEDL